MAKTRRNPNTPTDDVYETGRDSFSNRENQQVYERTKAGIDNLRQSTIDYSLSNASTRSDLTVERTGLEYEKDMHTLVGFLSVLDKLLEEIKDTKKGISKRGLSKAGKKTMKEAKAKLNQYEKQLKAKKKSLLKQNKAGRCEIYENDISNLRSLWQQLDRVRKDIGMGQWGEFANNAGYLYNSPETARKSNKRQADNLEFNQNFQQDLKEGAISTIFNGNVQEANAFLRRIAQGEYTAADYQIYVTNSNVFNPYFQRYQIAIPTNPRGTVGRIERTSRTIRRSVDYSNMDWGDTFKQGGVAGLIDKVLTNCSNMTPGQRDTWKTLGVLGIIGGVIYGQYKFYTSKKIGLGTKIGLTILPIFGSQFLTGKDPITLFSELLTGGLSMDELKDKFGNAVGGLSSSGSEAAEIAVPALQSEMVFNSGATVASVQQMTQTFKADRRNRRNFYQQSCDKIQREYGNSATESFRATFSEDFDEEKWKNWLASFGITGSTDSKETVHELADNAYNNKVIFEKFLADNKLKPTTDSNKKSELDAYILGKNEKNEQIKISDLEAHKNDWFMSVEANTGPTNPQQTNPEQHNDKDIEIKNETLKPAVERGLSKIFKHFKSKRGKLVERLGISEKNVPKHSTWITEDIKSKVFKIKGNTVTLDLSDNNLKEIYDKGIEKIIELKPGWTSLYISNKEIRRHNRNGLKGLLRQWGIDGNKADYDKRKNFLVFVFQSLFEEIVPVLQQQGGKIEYSCNGQKFNNLSDAIKTLQILHT